MEDGGGAGAGAAGAAGPGVALLPPRPHRHGVQPARRQPGLPPIPRIQLLPGHLDSRVAVRHGAGPARRPPARLRAGPDRDEEGVGPRRLRRRPGRRLPHDIGNVRGGAGDGLHAPEGGQPVHRLGGGGYQHGILRLRCHRPLCSRLRVQPFHGSPCIACIHISQFSRSATHWSHYMIIQQCGYMPPIVSWSLINTSVNGFFWISYIFVT